MAAKKKAVAKKAPAKAKKAPAAPVHKDSVAVKVLASLPALTGKLRAAYRASFSDEQCEAWGEKTKAANVIREAEGWLVTMDKALKSDPAVAYSRRRLAYLAELVVLLQDEVSRTTDNSGSELRATRSAALAVAVNARRELARLIRAVAGGREKILSALAKLSPEREESPSEVQDSLTATIDFALKLRRDEITEALADDVGLTEARLNAAYSALEALTGAREIALNKSAYEGDAPTVNVIEGRVLRELRLAQRLFNEAREQRVNVPVLVPGPEVRAVFRKDDEAQAATPAAPMPQA